MSVKTRGAERARWRAQSDKKRAILSAFFEQTHPGAHARGSQTKLSKIGAVAFNARQRPDRFSCPLPEPSLHSARQGFENWRLFLGSFLKAPLPVTVALCRPVTPARAAGKLQVSADDRSIKRRGGAPSTTPLSSVGGITQDRLTFLLFFHTAECRQLVYLEFSAGR